MTLLFPDLSVSREEQNRHVSVGNELAEEVAALFLDFCGVLPTVHVSGSTSKGTALPERYFGIDIDVVVLATPDIVARVAYPGDVFEGCQLFKVTFAVAFARRFERAYCAGHRLSGHFRGYPFDLSLADAIKDQWKWDYNASRYLQLDAAQIGEVRKIKYLLKTFNAAGSEVHGIVGPAVELGIYHHGTMEGIVAALRRCSPFSIPGPRMFETAPFPQAFHEIFPPVDDYVHKGLLQSFRFTVPNTFDRLLEVIRAQTLSVDRYIRHHVPRFSYRRTILGHNMRMALYVLQHMLPESELLHIDLLSSSSGIDVLASCPQSLLPTIDQCCDLISELQRSGEVCVRSLPSQIRQSIMAQLSALRGAKARVFIGMPQESLVPDAVYIPLDLLTRTDSDRLVAVLCEVQNETT